MPVPTKLLGALTLLTVVSVSAPVSWAQDGSSKEPFKLQVEEKGTFQESSYPAPQMLPNPAVQPVPKKPPKKLNASAQQQQMQPMPPMQASIQQRPPMQAGVQQQKELPVQFMGVWQVAGQRRNVEALPQYQQGIDGIFTMQNSQIWQISGSPKGGYSLSSNTGVQTPLFVDGVQGNTAFLRYQHPIKNTMAQEAIVMSLTPDGQQFQGLERISIVKQGEPGPRAKVTYGLLGRRQR